MDAQQVSHETAAVLAKGNILRANLTQIINERTDLRAANEKLTEQFHRAQEYCRDADKTCAALRSTRDSLQAELAEARIEARDARDAMYKAKCECVEIQTTQMGQEDTLQSTIRELRKEVETEKQTVEASEKKTKDIIRSFQAWEKYWKNKDAIIRAAEERLKQREQQLEKKQSELCAAQEKLSAVGDNPVSKMDLDAVVCKLQDQVATAQQSLEGANAKLAKGEQAAARINGALQVELIKIQHKAEDANARCTKAANAEREKSDKRYRERIVELSHMQGRARQAETNLLSSKSEIERLTALLTECQASKAKAEQMLEHSAADCQHLQKRAIVERETAIRSHKIDASQKDNMIQNLHTQIATQESAIKRQLERHDSDVATKQELDRQLSSLQKEVFAVKEALRSAQGAYTATQIRLEEKQGQCSILEARMMYLGADKTELKEKLTIQERRITTKVTQEVNSLWSKRWAAGVLNAKQAVEEKKDAEYDVVAEDEDESYVAELVDDEEARPTEEAIDMSASAVSIGVGETEEFREYEDQYDSEDELDDEEILEAIENVE